MGRWHIGKNPQTFVILEWSSMILFSPSNNRGEHCQELGTYFWKNSNNVLTIQCKDGPNKWRWVGNVPSSKKRIYNDNDKHTWELNSDFPKYDRICLNQKPLEAYLNSENKILVCILHHKVWKLGLLYPEDFLLGAPSPPSDVKKKNMPRLVAPLRFVLFPIFRLTSHRWEKILTELHFFYLAPFTLAPTPPLPNTGAITEYMMAPVFDSEFIAQLEKSTRILSQHLFSLTNH